MKVKDLIFANLANLTTTVRLIFSVWLVVLALHSAGQLFLMLILVNLCGLTDTADGWMARRFHIESQIGSFLDRLADKVFICPTISILTLRYWSDANISSEVQLLTGSLVVVIVLLEVILMISGLSAFVKGLDIRSNQWGRAKMVCQSTAIYIWFLSLTIENYLKIEVLSLSIFLINFILVVAIGLAVKSIEGYWEKWQSHQKTI